ncbi:uncharacterized protein FIBRA_00150 [Fibroporia radiculosa]|uniref:non-specific serine/threonine protein kinase n=1 Tax=Fibroporia radiculosa TaxID=599839 RepID=J7SBV8_9APHY|nr:uncharacterized protein FIBRA_00150 [Fibroporia radiculosa]CCL98156.1 predicted protein [Fibroporia radiculosa]
MAQAYPPAYMQQANKGTLVPGQTISVNKYTVQVERYLSQGGFAHVYLVRTATPVFNTTHHVLKRIAVPSEAMLTEVKKEVDIMRILKGHPNIVYLIDAAWHRLSNGTYEVFILMEFCSGGGIIDMMNRRLRERLTEPEILTIFCDVCEGLAAMHALKPPLLHRDLKVENILQSSATLYKLCDFGSTTPVQKIPSNTQEMRMLEADLNRHTTLQYRAPEMVDVYQRRPVDEKSDVWALGVLLYKLCYYTTPFEEHGPLAILNVQYKIPPYPVYSNDMNSLIASMLREHGSQRPTVFEILAHVHKLRGTKSRFSYSIPLREPALSSRTIASPSLQNRSPNLIPPTQQNASSLENLVSYKSSQPLVSSVKTPGIEARDKVLEAIAPMRRGRPTPSPAMPSPPASPKKERTFGLDAKFSAEDDRIWRGVRGHKSGLASIGGGGVDLSRDVGDAWAVGSKERKQTQAKGERGPDSERQIFEKAFPDDFSASFGKSFGDSFQPARSPAPTAPSYPAPSPSPKPQSFPQTRAPPSPKPSPGLTQIQRHQSTRKAKDAFEGLGFSTQPPPQTLGEARKSRTGLAGLGVPTGLSSSSASAQYLNAPSRQPSGLGTVNTTYRPPSAHAPMPTHSPQPAPQSQIPLSIGAQPQVRSQSSQQAKSLTAEERFPSLEELDRDFGSPPSDSSAVRDKLAHLNVHASTQPPYTEKLSNGSRPPSRANHMSNLRATGVDGLPGVTALSMNGVDMASATQGRYDGVRSQTVTGTAMRDSQLGGGLARHASTSARPPPTASTRESQPKKDGKQDRDRSQDVIVALKSRPSAARRHKHSPPSNGPSRTNSANLLSPSSPESATPSLPPRSQPRSEPRDWLTGGDEDELATPPLPFRAEPQPQPVLRESPSKRASIIERSPIVLQKPLEAENVLETYHIPITSLENRTRETRERERKKLQRSPERKTMVPRTGTGATTVGAGGATSRMWLPPVDTTSATRTMGKLSPNGLTDNWSPIAPMPDATVKSSSSSSSDDGPEDLHGYSSRWEGQHVKEAAKSNAENKRRRARSKGRQGSVHDLVDIWSGGKGPGLDNVQDEGQKASHRPTSKQTDKRASVITPSPSLRPPSLAPKPRSGSPQPLIDTSSYSSRMLSSQAPSPSSPHRRQPSNAPIVQQPPSPSLTPAPTMGRSRPQSMFVTSLSKSSAESNTTSSKVAASAGYGMLSPPADPVAKRTSRRSSISDMVQRFEAIGGNTRGHNLVTLVSPSAVAPKPANLDSKTKSLSGENNVSLSSPSAAAARFPRLSPTSSPIMSRTSMSVPDDPTLDHPVRDLSKNRTSPSGMPRSSSPIGRLDTSSVVNGLPSRRSPLPVSRSSEPEASSTHTQERLTSPFPLRKATAPPEDIASSPLRSPSPERLYQGVSKLIDRWQRAADDSGVAPAGGVKRGFPARRIGGDAGRGR